MTSGTTKLLEGVRVAVLAADGFEQVEVIRPIKALRKAGADVRVISLRPGRIRGMNFLWRGRKLPVDDTVDHARAEDYGALLLPGGFVNPDLLRQSARARDFVRQFEALGRPIATICHGPQVLISAGLLKGRRLASWPGIADDVRNAGAVWTDEPVVRDNNWVSSRSPTDLREFVPAMLTLFSERSPYVGGELPRRVRWAAMASRALSLGALAAVAFGSRAAWRHYSQARTQRQLESWMYTGLAALGAPTGRNGAGAASGIGRQLRRQLRV